MYTQDHTCLKQYHEDKGCDKTVLVNQSQAFQCFLYDSAETSFNHLSDDLKLAYMALK